MTEAQWLKCKNPEKMLEYLRGKVSDRKIRLFNIACCRRVWPLITNDAAKRAVEVSERYADDSKTFNELRRAWKAVFAVWSRLLDPSSHTFVRQETVTASLNSAYVGSFSTDDISVHRHAAAAVVYASVGEDEPDEGSKAGNAVMNAELTAQADLLRDIIGNPLRPVKVDSDWRTSQATKLAKIIYRDRAFDRMPQLANELKAAGCRNPVMLTHCKDGQEHVRGCWLVDLVLGKS